MMTPAKHTPEPMHPPVVEGPWVRPAPRTRAEPRWGRRDGLQVGLHPLGGGPRGLLRLYAPYLDHPPERLTNFIAFEPTPRGATSRGYSELERSGLDDVSGKRFWSTDEPADDTPRPATEPARGVVETVDGVERLRVYVHSEPFDNGASVYVRLTFRADAPHQVGLAAYTHSDSVELEHCILTATMGNFARLRELHLADRTVTPTQLWPGFAGDAFTSHARFGLGELTVHEAGGVQVWATPDETEPQAVTYATDTAEHWKYFGRRAVQRWWVPDPDPALEVLVNGRHCYWASTSPIPGGTSYENFEICEPYQPGREQIFSIEPLD